MNISPAPACTQANIQQFSHFGYPNACKFVQTACAGETAKLNFFDLYYCDTDQNLLLFLPFSLIFLIATFYIISSTAENYLEPVLSKIAKKLGLSDSLAGVTLVALANGAPDVFAAFAAGSKTGGGVLIPLGGLLGAGILTTSIVFAACIFFSQQMMVRADKNALKRDSIFYLISVLYIFAMGMYGEINLVGSLGFFVQYTIFIGVVLYQETQYRKVSLRAQQQSLLAKKEPSYDIVFHHDDDDIKDKQKIDLTISFLENHLKSDNIDTLDSLSIPLASLVTKEDCSICFDRPSKAFATGKRHHAYYRLRHKIWKEFRDIQGRNSIFKAIYIVIYPIKLARDLTIPAPTVSQWDKSKAIVQPLTVSLFLIWQFGLVNILENNKILVLYLATCLIMSGLIWKFAISHESPSGLVGGLMKVMAFVASVVWINLLANTIVDFIALLAVFTSLPLNYLSLTLLTFGNSTGDFFVDVALAKKGFDQTAVSGIFAGQYFNLAIGFGASLTKQIMNSGPKQFSLLPTGKTSLVNLILVACLTINLIVVLCFGKKNNYVFSKNFIMYSLVLYFCFLISVTFLSL